jgi:hypothetical protein
MQGWLMKKFSPAGLLKELSKMGSFHSQKYANPAFGGAHNIPPIYGGYAFPDEQAK